MKRVAFVLLSLAIGCAPRAAPTVGHSPAGPPARIDLARVLAGHPFAPLLAQYARDIDTLRTAQRVPAFAGFGARLSSSAAGVNRQLADAGTRIARVQPAPIASLPAGFGNTPEFGAGTLLQFQQAADQRIARALDLRAQQLREREANVAFAFERANGARRMLLRLKLRNLHLDAKERHAYSGELRDLDAREALLVNAQRRRATRVLAEYGGRLRARAARDAAALRTELADHARAARAVPEPHVTGLPPGLLRDRRADAVAAFATARQDLTQRYAELRRIDATDRAGLTAEIAALTRERNALRTQMIAQIRSRAQSLARSLGLGTVYAGRAPDGARDLTDAVVRSLHDAGR